MSSYYTCYTIDEAIEAPINTKTAFIIANERITKSKRIGRYYTIFPTFKEFLENRTKFKHCHELLVDHKNARSNIAGRLVFDFDFKKIKVPKKFTKQIENTMLEVI